MSSPSALATFAYASRAARPFSSDELADLVRVCRACNAADGITGVLLYSGAHFVQVLEGPREALMATVERICHDRRHCGIVVLRAAPLAERLYADWSMAFVEGERFAGFPGLDALLLPEFTPAAALGDVEGTLDLMHRLTALAGAGA